jgi:hypothetical protein
MPGRCRDDDNVTLRCLPIRRRSYLRNAIGAKGGIGKIFNLRIPHAEINVDEEQLVGDGVECKIVCNSTANIADAYNRDT